MNRKHTLNFKIRKMTIKDFPTVVKLWKRSKLRFKPKGRDNKKRIVRELKSSTSIFLIATAKNRIVGVIFGTHDGRKGWINRLAVDPDFQHFGIARSLAFEVEKKFLKIGIGIFACLIESSNKGSMVFFKNIGYKKHRDIVYFTKRINPDI